MVERDTYRSSSCARLFCCSWSAIQFSKRFRQARAAGALSDPALGCRDMAEKAPLISAHMSSVLMPADVAMPCQMLLSRLRIFVAPSTWAEQSVCTCPTDVLPALRRLQSVHRAPRVLLQGLWKSTRVSGLHDVQKRHFGPLPSAIGFNRKIRRPMLVISAGTHRLVWVQESAYCLHAFLASEA